MDSDGNPLTAARLAKQSMLPRFLKTFRRRLLGCESCSRKIDGPWLANKVSVAELERSATDGCQTCSLILEAVRYCVPHSSLYTGELEYIIDQNFKYLQLRWHNPYSQPEVDRGFPKGELSIDLDLYILNGHTYVSKKRIELMTATSISGDTSSDASWQWAMSRLEKCTKTHKACGFIKEKPLPTRVLELSVGGKDVRLYETKNETGQYVALNHCWGDSRAITTTLNTLRKNKELITWDSLAKTFQDAILIVRRLGIRYLWIDSLCIIQDDPADWSKESGKMADVYQDAYLTIAATKSSSHDGGCFSTAASSHLSHQLTLSHNRPSQIYARRSLPHEVFWSHDSKSDYGCDKFPLFRRAWCYQEGLLSPRVVHFAADEVMWDCREDFDCECSYMAYHKAWAMSYGKVDLPKIDHTRALEDPLRLPLRWWNIVEEYSDLDLSCAQDKLPALSGLAKQMQRPLNGRYLAGLWESNLLLDLLWQTLPGESCGRCLPWRAPTWSWASITSTITWPHIFRLTDSWDQVIILASMVEANCNPAGADVTGEVSSGHLTLSGRLASTYWVITPNETDHRSFDYVLNVNSTVFKGYRLYPDIPLHENREAMVKPGLELHCLEIAEIKPHDRFYLVLEESKNEPGAYERVGLLHTVDRPCSAAVLARSQLAVVKIV